jgi:hypothetical protein
MSTIEERVRAAVERVDADPSASTKKQSHTLQTRRVAAALRAIGLKRTEFRCRVTYETQRGTRYYGHAIGSPHTAEGAALVEEHAQALAAAGFAVHLIGERSHFVASGDAGVRDHRVEVKR